MLEILKLNKKKVALEKYITSLENKSNTLNKKINAPEELAKQKQNITNNLVTDENWEDGE